MSQVPMQPKNNMELVLAQKPAIAMAIGGRTPEERNRRADRFARICLTALRKTPKLMQCNPMSFASALMVCAQLDLEPNTPQGLAYLIPYGTECQFQVGYKGLLQLAYRSGMVQSFNADVVYENEIREGLFEYHKGIAPSIRHDVDFLRPELRQGKIVAAYASCTLVGGQPLLRVIDAQDVARAKASSSAGKSGKPTPWQTHEASMWMKTAIKRLAAWMPQTEMLALAVESDDRSERGESLDVVEDESVAQAAAVSNVSQLNSVLQDMQESAPDPEDIEQPEPQPKHAPQKAAAKRMAPKEQTRQTVAADVQQVAKEPEPQKEDPAQSKDFFDPRAQAASNIHSQFEDFCATIGATDMEIVTKILKNYCASEPGATMVTAKHFFLQNTPVFEEGYKRMRRSKIESSKIPPNEEQAM